jgi:DNA-binding NtrC family response regulator
LEAILILRLLKEILMEFDLILADKKSCLNVLNVDDDICSLEVSKEILELTGNFRVDIATSVDVALRKMETQSYDVIVSDYKMPGKNGLDFLKEICLLGNTTPFILFSGKGTKEIASVAFNLGAFRYVNKCGNPETVYGELADSIREAFEQAQREEKFAETLKQLRQLLYMSLS